MDTDNTEQVDRARQWGSGMSLLRFDDLKSVVLTKKQAPMMGACSCIEAYKLLLKSGHATAASTEAEHTHQA